MGEHFTAGNGEFAAVEHQNKRAQAFGVVSSAPFVLNTVRKKKSRQRQKKKEQHGKGFEQRRTVAVFHFFPE